MEYQSLSLFGATFQQCLSCRCQGKPYTIITIVVCFHRYEMHLRRRLRVWLLVWVGILAGIWIMFFSLQHPDQDMSTWEPLLLPFNSSLKVTVQQFRQTTTNHTLYHNKWIIMIAVSPPDTTMVEFCKTPGWRILVIGSDRYASQWRQTSCIYHTKAEQETLDFKSVKYLHYDQHFVMRKNTAVLFAVSKGADIIVDLDVNDVSTFQSHDLHRKWYMMKTHSALFNPFAHFSYTDDGHNTMSYYILKGVVPNIQALMPNTNYVSRGDLAGQIRKFDAQAPAIMTSTDTLLRFIPKSRIYQRQSFWVAVSFPTATSVQRELCQHQWQQRLLWEIGGYYLIHPSSSQFHYTQKLNNSYDHNICESALRSEKCSEISRPLDCARQLTESMLKHGLWTNEYKEVLVSWTRDLVALNYELFQRKDLERPNIVTSVNYAPKRKPTQVLQQKRLAFFGEVCQSFSLPYKMDYTSKRAVVEDILLLMVFNFPIYHYVSWIHNMYSSKYRSMAYCGEEKHVFIEATRHLNYSLTFIEQNVERGYYVYKCVSAAIKMGYNVSGILMVSDDVLLNTWNVDSLPIDRPWLHQIYKINRDQEHNWNHWRHKWGQRAAQAVWNEISEITEKSATIRTNFRQFNKRLHTLTNSSSGASFGYSDITYVPKRLFNDFVFYCDIFSKHGAFLEVTIPTILAGLVEYEELVMLNGSYLWGLDRDDLNYKKFYNKDHVFMHPFKIGLEAKKKESVRFLCHDYFPLLI